MSKNKPCLCASCTECGSVFWATAIREEFLTDSDENKDTLNTASKYFTEGFNVTVKDASEFKMDFCEHLKQYKNG